MGDVVVRKMVDIDGGPIPKGRVSKRLEKAIRLIEEEGYSISQAAEAVDYTNHSLTQALRKPHVRAFRADVKRAWRSSAAPKAWNQITRLAEDAQSEKVRLEAAKTVLVGLGDLSEEAEKAATGPAIQIIRNEVHNYGQPLTQRLPGVVDDEAFQDVECEPLDHDSGLTALEEG